MKLDTLKDGDTIYVQGKEYIFNGTTMLGDEEYMRCIKVENDVPMLVSITSAIVQNVSERV